MSAADGIQDRETHVTERSLRGVIAAVADATPDVVHVNGLMFAGAVAALRALLPARTVLVLQDHSGSLPRALPWPLDRLQASRWRDAFRSADACTFTARALACGSARGSSRTR